MQFPLLSFSLLPPQFPQEKPVVSVYPPVGHHLIDSNNGTMINSPLITNVSSFPNFGFWLICLSWWFSPVVSSGVCWTVEGKEITGCIFSQVFDTGFLGGGDMHDNMYKNTTQGVFHSTVRHKQEEEWNQYGHWWWRPEPKWDLLWIDFNLQLHLV